MGGVVNCMCLVHFVLSLFLPLQVHMCTYTLQLHVRGGSIIPMQLGPGLTTTETRKNPYSLLVALAGGGATGDLYLDDGETYNTTE